MTEKEFHALKRIELLEIMRMQEEECVRLKEENLVLCKEKDELLEQREEWNAERAEWQAERAEWQVERGAHQAVRMDLLERLEKYDPVPMADKIEITKRLLDDAKIKTTVIVRDMKTNSAKTEIIASQTAETIQDLLQIYFTLLGIKP